MQREFPTYYGGLEKRYKSKALCRAGQLNAYLETLDLLLRKDKYSFNQVVTATRFAMEDDFWKEQFRTLSYLRKNKDDQPAYIAIFLSKAGRRPEARQTQWLAKLKVQADRKKLEVKNVTRR